MLAFKSMTAPVEPALDTFQGILLPLSQFIDLHEYPESETTIANECR